MSANTILIIASSARMLAAAAKQQGWQPIVIDLYHDVDTQAYALKSWQASSLAMPVLQALVEQCCTEYAVQYVLYGSGLEQHPDSLAYLAARFTLLGNAPATSARVLDKAHFFAQLQQLAIPYPATQFTPPAPTQGWLRKAQRSQGGVGIQHATPQSDSQNEYYWQRWQAGASGSVLFLADGCNARVLGFNRQWCSAEFAETPFLFAGISNHNALPAQLQQQLQHWTGQLTRVFALQGLNSLDFIYTDAQCWLLEINARPPASMQLYPPSLFTWHIQACTGQLTSDPLPAYPFMAYQICYAPVRLQIPVGFDWPPACVDLPQNAAIINAGQPICSMIASADNPATLKQRVQSIQQTLFKKLFTGT